MGGEGKEGGGIDDRVEDRVGVNSTSIIIWKGREGREREREDRLLKEIIVTEITS